MRGPFWHEADGREPAPITRRLLLRLAALAGIGASLVTGNHSATAAVCAPRGAGCTVLRPCCDGSPCRFFGANPFVGLCPGHGAIALLRSNTTLWSPARARRALLLGDVTCDDFRTRRHLQRFLRRNPGFDRTRLEDDNGRLCRDLRAR